MNHYRLKNILYILLILLCANIPLSAQVTAVMKIQVNVVSGAKVNASKNLLYSSKNGTFKAGFLSIRSAPNSEINVETESECFMKSTSGERVRILTSSNIEEKFDSGNQTISIHVDIPDSEKLEGNYSGSITTVINYL